MRAILAMFCIAVFGLAVVAGDPPRLKCPPKINQEIVYVQPAPVQVSYSSSYSGVVPAGYHAHQTLDGRTIVHGNENFGNATAHQGIAYPWIRIGEAGQYVGGQSYGFPTSLSSCPGGNCPSPTVSYGPFGRRR